MTILKVSPYGIENFEQMYNYSTNEMKLKEMKRFNYPLKSL